MYRIHLYLHSPLHLLAYWCIWKLAIFHIPLGFREGQDVGSVETAGQWPLQGMGRKRVANKNTGNLKTKEMNSKWWRCLCCWIWGLWNDMSWSIIPISAFLSWCSAAASYITSHTHWRELWHQLICLTILFLNVVDDWRTETQINTLIHVHYSATVLPQYFFQSDDNRNIIML